MDQIPLNQQPKNHDLSCSDLLTMAERELAAFFTAVTELFGSEQAKISAEDWLRELMALDNLPINNLTNNDLANNDLPNNDLLAATGKWRQLTIKVSARLASRVNASSISTASQILAFSN
jgi:hypothetical protein